MHSAVRQWAGNVADLDFACAIRKAPVFLLVAMHLPEVEALSQEDALKKLVPASAKKKCAFYRIWVRLNFSQIRTPALGAHLKALRRFGFDHDVVCLQCLVELSAALKGSKPVMMLIGAADKNGRFVPALQRYAQCNTWCYTSLLV